MSANPLVVDRVDTTSPLAGTLLLEDGDQLVKAVQDGDWIRRAPPGANEGCSPPP